MRHIHVGDSNVISVRSGQHGSCVGVSRPASGVVEITHTKIAKSPVIALTDDGFEKLTQALAAGAIRLGRGSMPIGEVLNFGEVVVRRDGTDEFVWVAQNDGETITFTVAEMDSFIDGCYKGEFELSRA